MNFPKSLIITLIIFLPISLFADMGAIIAYDGFEEILILQTESTIHYANKIICSANRKY